MLAGERLTSLFPDLVDTDRLSFSVRLLARLARNCGDFAALSDGTARGEGLAPELSQDLLQPTDIAAKRPVTSQARPE